MKKIRLSSPGERAGAWFVTVILALLVAFILSAPGKNAGYYIFASLCALFAAGLALLYLVAVTRAAVLPDSDGSIRISGLISLTESCSGAVSVSTEAVSVGPLSSRSIVLRDVNGGTVCTVSTMFTLHEGVMAEPAAMELAELLSLEFVPTVEKWKYDPEAMAEHRAELKRMKKEQRRRGKKNASPAEENPKNGEDRAEDINYDALDDLR